MFCKLFIDIRIILESFEVVKDVLNNIINQIVKCFNLKQESYHY